MLSVEAVHDRSICDPLIGVAANAVGGDGGVVSALTAMLMGAFVLPNALLAVIVYAVAVCEPVGVPVISQVVALITRPAGSPGAEAHVVTLPVKVGVAGAMGFPCVNV